MDISAKIKENIDLAPLTTFKIGGVARFFVEVGNIDEILAVFEWLDAHPMPYFLMSGGSNLLVSDEGFAGLVIKMTQGDIKVKGKRFECFAGASMARAVTLAASNGFSGLEWAAGLPGSVGGAVRGNAGCFGGEMADLIEIVTVFNVRRKEIENISNKDCYFNYRSSRFKEDDSQKYIIVGATMKLDEGDSKLISEKMFDNISRRSKKQPKLPSAGSVFMNIPIKDVSEESEIFLLATEAGVVTNGMIPAGWLIDQLGLRGLKSGGAKISMEHANFIVNTGHATAADVVSLIGIMKQKARGKYGVQLKEEVVYL